MHHLNCLLLAGGQSSRMGTPKHLLALANGQPVFAYLLERLHEACPQSDLYISVHSHEQAAVLPPVLGLRYRVLCDSSGDTGDVSGYYIGPAAGLLAAYEEDAHCHWMVLACDYPLMTSSDLKLLVELYEEPVTCFQNADGFLEPLVAIWSPNALQALASNVEVGKTGPTSTIRQLQGTSLRAIEETSLHNTNDQEDWARAMDIAQSWSVDCHRRIAR